MSLQKILFVDDDPTVLSSLARHLHKAYEVHTARGGAEAVRMVAQDGPFAVLVSDYRMPGMNGIQLFTRVREAAPDTVRIMLTGNADLEMAIDAINQGDIFRFLLKPCKKENLLQAVIAGVEQYQLILSELELLEKTLKGSIKVLVDILSMTHPDVFKQVSSLRHLARDLAVRMGSGNLWEVELAVSLSQIGCVTLPKEILHMKGRGRFLSDEDLAVFYSHPKIGSDLVGNIPRLEAIAKGIAYQNKSYDGKGNPADDLSGIEIPWLGRLLKVILDYDDLLRKGYNNEKALQALSDRAGQYDPSILDALRAELTGKREPEASRPISLYQLESGMILARDVTDNRGSVLITQKTLITDVLRIRLLNYTAFHSIQEPILVFVS